MNVDRLREALASMAGRRVLVIGDLMLDEYVWGTVSRISPDAPVQVVDIKSRSMAAGGAANVAHNIAAAGGRPILAGLRGGDEAGRELSELVRAAGVEEAGVLVDEGRPTTVKTRVVARGQHVVRLDREVRTPLAPPMRARLLAALAPLVERADAVVVSDYAKGVVDARLVADLADLVARAGGGRPILVDPKSPDLTRYAGCDAVTPNEKEAEAAARMTIASADDLAEAGRRIRDACGARWVLITRGDRGMALCEDGQAPEIIEARAREVYDVTGAGDTVVAYFGLGLAAGLGASEAAALANFAAGVGVGKVGTTVVAPAEILAAGVGASSGPWKIVGLREAAARVEHERSRGRAVVFTNGCFDLLHAGHVHLLERARGMGDFLVVALNTDASVRRLKGEGRPLVGEEDRAKVVAALDAVDLVVLFDEDTPLTVIEAIRPDVLVKGGDYRIETIVGHELVLGYGGKVSTIPLLGGRSTSQLIEGIKKAGA